MRVAVLGAAGIIGREIARTLVSEGSKDLLLTDLRKDSVRALGKDLGVDALPLDVTDAAETARALKGCDLAVNAAWYYFNLQVMEACLSARCGYLDLGGLYHTTLRQLDLSSRFEDAGLLALLGCGKAPGITNVLAAKGSTRFDQIRSVHLRSGRRPLEAARGIRLPYSPQTLFDEFLLRPMVLRGGRPREDDALSGRETVRYGEPFGDIEYIMTLHSELATLPRYLGKGVREMEFKVALASDTVHAMETLIGLGLSSDDAVDVPGGRVSPRDVAVAALSRLPQVRGKEIWIAEAAMEGERGGVAQALSFRVTGTENENGTALAAVAGIRLWEKGLLKESGVRAPEDVVPPEEFFRLLEERGMHYSETRTVPGGKG